MVRRDGAEARKERIEKIARSIQATLHIEKELQLSKTLAALEYDTGLTEDRLMEYIEIIERLGQITIDLENDKIKKPVA